MSWECEAGKRRPLSIEHIAASSRQPSRYSALCVPSRRSQKKTGLSDGRTTYIATISDLGFRVLGFGVLGLIGLMGCRAGVKIRLDECTQSMLCRTAALLTERPAVSVIYIYIYNYLFVYIYIYTYM